MVCRVLLSSARQSVAEGWKAASSCSLLLSSAPKSRCDLLALSFPSDVTNGSVTFLPLEDDDEGNLEVKMSNVYQLRLHHSEGEW